MPAFPTFVFRSPGPQRHSSGGAYRFVPVNNEADLAEMLGQGYHADVRTAIAACGERAFTHGLTTTQARKVNASKLLARLQARLAENTIPAAVVEVEEPAAVAPEPVAPPADDAPPTRAELEQQAVKLGVRFRASTSDERLLERINEAMKEA